MEDNWTSIKQPNLVVYTAIIGGYDTLKDPEYITPNCDYVCFTDQDLKSDVWDVRKVIPLYTDNTRTARKYKTLPHRFLSEYDVSIWVDGNIRIVGNAMDYANMHLLTYPMAVHDHMDCFDKRNCVYQEANAIFQLGQQNGGNFKDDPSVIQKQMQRYIDDGYPPNNTLVFTCTVLRYHNIRSIIDFNERWWQEIKYGSKRDQLSFNYAAWKLDTKFTYTGHDGRSNVFAKHTTHTK